jgi:hypothetical protein
MLDWNPKEWEIEYEPPEFVANVTKPWDNDPPETHLLKDHDVVVININSFVQFNEEPLT